MTIKSFRIDMSGDDENEILALKNGSRRIIDETSSMTDSCMLSGGECLAFVQGAFHCLGILSTSCMVSFNISEEMYGEIPLPEIVEVRKPFKLFDKKELVGHPARVFSKVEAEKGSHVYVHAAQGSMYIFLRSHGQKPGSPTQAYQPDGEPPSTWMSRTVDPVEPKNSTSVHNNIVMRTSPQQNQQK
ncbi:hypothetical protein RND71_011134 [Anisodus tanguticus]|uniref:Uncharacterized protein n=1 Tax=Anisodus tanguticus TaxID=243964 RepID=A0AAE1VFS0_9SOLA|nr:hypothetical protein RND71_011134 [Anisodus tanguticus]